MSIRSFVIISLSFLLFSCTANKQMSSSITGVTGKPTELFDDQTFLVTKVSTDPDYAFTKNKPVNVGGVKSSEGPLNERRYLNALTGPNGEPISYYRSGSCCTFETPNGEVS